MREPIQVLIYPVKLVGDNWQYLLLRRPPNGGGFWQGVTGGVEKGESLIEAAKRELFEETGFVPSLIENLNKSYSFRLSDRYKHLYADGVQVIVEHVFVAYVDSKQEPVLDPREHNAWRWCSFKEALELLKWPNNIDALKRCHNFLNRKLSLF